MPKKKSPYPDRPWNPDPFKWAKLLEKQLPGKTGQLTPTEPKGGWMLFNWKTMEDAKQ